MTPREELDLILTLIQKYSLPLSPILEYAISEKKDEFPEDTMSKASENKEKYSASKMVVETVIAHEEEPTVVLTSKIIEAARTPNGGFTKSQLAAIGIGWPAPQDWIKQMTGKMITQSQLDKFNQIVYVEKPSKSSIFGSGSSTYKNVAGNPTEEKRMLAVLNAMDHFDAPATPRDIARAISRSAWGGSAIKEDYVDSLLKRLPEVEYIQWGKYILKKR